MRLKRKMRNVKDCSIKVKSTLEEQQKILKVKNQHNNALDLFKLNNADTELIR